MICPHQIPSGNDFDPHCGLCQSDKWAPPPSLNDDAGNGGGGSQRRLGCNHNVKHGKICYHCRNAEREAALAAAPNDEETALLQPTALVLALRNAGATLSANGDINVRADGVHVLPNGNIVPYGHNPLGLKLTGFLLLFGLLSVFSGVPGAEAEGSVFGRWGNVVGSCLATLFLNFLGAIDTAELHYRKKEKWKPIYVPVNQPDAVVVRPPNNTAAALVVDPALVARISHYCSNTVWPALADKMWSVFTYGGGFAGAITSGCLAGLGASEVFSISSKLGKIFVIALFGFINWFISGLFNVDTLNSLPSLGQFILRVTGRRAWNESNVWESRREETIARVLLGVCSIPAFMATFYATVGRGEPTNEDVRKYFHTTGGGLTIFAFTGAIGFVMFFAGIVKLFLLIERMIKFVYYRLGSRLKAKWSIDGNDLWAYPLALAMVGFLAYFIIINYVGLIKKAYSNDDVIGQMLRMVVFSVISLATYPAAGIAGINLIRRVEKLVQLLKMWTEQFQDRNWTYDDSHPELDKIIQEYKAAHPDAEHTVQSIYAGLAESLLTPDAKFTK